MDIFHASELADHRGEIAQRLREGQLGIFPTDTIYGLTVDARNHQAVERILELKQRRTPVSCIPHSLKWARQLVRPEARDRFDQNMPRYFGRYTTLWPSSLEAQLAHPLVQTAELVGMRFPEHWITDFAREAELPLTTTSVNRTGQPPMNSLETLDPSLKPDIDFLVYEGSLQGKPSTLVRCDGPDFLELPRS